MRSGNFNLRSRDYIFNLILLTCIIIYTYIYLGPYNYSIDYILTYIKYSLIETIIFVILVLIPFSKIFGATSNNIPRYNQSRNTIRSKNIIV
jgi:hypothetical protein